MYLNITIATNVKAAAMETAPFGPGFTEEQAAKADKMEIWSSEFKDPGPDFNEYRLFNKEVKIAEKRINGY